MLQKMMINNYFNKQRYIIFSFIILFLSVGAETYHFLLFDKLDTPLYQRLIINIRLLLPLATFGYLLIFSNKNFFKIPLQIDSLFILKVFFICQLISTLINIDNFSDFHKVLLPIFSIYLIVLVKSSNDYELSKKLFFTYLFFLFFINIFYLNDLYKYFFSYGISDLYSILLFKLPVIEKVFIGPGTNGISRSLLIIYFFVFISFLRNNKKPLLILLLFINIAQFHLQSRFALLIIFPFSIFLLHINKGLKFKNKLYIFFVILVLPILFSGSISKVKNKILEFNITTKSRVINDFNTFKSTKNFNFDINKSIIEKNTPKFLKSIHYRLYVWSIVIKKNEKKLLGYGVLNDKAFLKEVNFYSRTPSNSLIYGYLSGGLISVILLVIFYLFIIVKLILFLIKKKIKKSKLDRYTLTSIITIFIILLRSIIENSFSIWGLDIIFLILSINLLNNKFKLKI